MAGLYVRCQKPADINDYLKQFVDELIELSLKGFFYGRPFFIKTIGFVCDAPARSFLISVVPHNSYYSCHKCVSVGEYIKKTHKKGW